MICSKHYQSLPNVKKYILFIVTLCLLLTGCSKLSEVRIQKQLDLGNKYLTEMNYEKAVIAFSKVIELDEKNVAAYEGAAKAYEALGQNDEAFSIALKGCNAIGDEPEQLKSCIIELFRNILNKAEDVEDYEHLASWLEQISAINIDEDQSEELKEELEAAILSEIYKAHEEYDIQRAEALTNILEKIDSESAYTYLARIELELVGAQFEAAEESVEKGLEKYPDNESLKKYSEDFKKGLYQNHQGEPLKEVWYSADGSMTSFLITTYSRNERKTQYYNGDGTLESTEIRTFDDDHQLVSMARYTVDGRLMESGETLSDGSEKQTWYNDDGSVDSYLIDYSDGSGYSVYNADGSLMSYAEYEYNEMGKVSRWSLYDADGTLLKYYLSEYDEKGNRTSYVGYNADGTVSAYLEGEQ